MSPTGTRPALRTTALAAAGFWLAALLYHLLARQLPPGEALPQAFIDAAALGLVFWLTQPQRVFPVTLGYLALPYLLFLPGWTQPWVGLPLALLLGVALWHALRHGPRPSPPAEGITGTGVAAFLLLAAWVVLSGAGGYGYQTQDYGMHNSRVRDLMQLPWPLQYGPDQQLVYYVGYYLPAAVVGKWSNVNWAWWFQFPWTLLGVVLAVRWLALLLHQPLTWLLALAFVLFGPLDLPGQMLVDFAQSGWQALPPNWETLANTDGLNFWTAAVLPYFLGNFLSNSFQLAWAPHQVVAGWLVAALAVQGFLQGSNRLLAFAFALLCLWAPVIMLGFLPVVAGMAWLNLFPHWRATFSFPNLLAVCLLAPLFLAFYLGGSSLSNPWHGTLPYLAGAQWLYFGLFHLLGWGLFLLLAWPWLRQAPARYRQLACLLAAGFLGLSLVVYGQWSDLVCRGAAPLSFLLLLLVLQAWRHYRLHGHAGMRALLLLGLLAGSVSGLQQQAIALQSHGQVVPPTDVQGYSLTYQYLGPDDSWFGRHLRRTRPSPAPPPP